MSLTVVVGKRHPGKGVKKVDCPVFLFLVEQSYTFFFHQIVPVLGSLTYLIIVQFVVLDSQIKKRLFSVC